MKYFKLSYSDGTFEYAKAPTALELIKERDLATAKHINTRIMELNSEMKALAIDCLEN